MKSERPLLLGIANVFLEMVSRVGALTDIEIPSFVPFGKLLQYNAQDDLVALTVPAFLDVMRLPITAISDLHFRAVICYFCCYFLIMAYLSILYMGTMISCCHPSSLANFWRSSPPGRGNCIPSILKRRPFGLCGRGGHLTQKRFILQFLGPT